MSARATAMSAVQSWALLAGLCLALVVACYLLGALLDSLLERHRDGLDDVHRHDRAREVMRGWMRHDDEEGER
jgi:hypothetical protein